MNWQCPSCAHFVTLGEETDETSTQIFGTSAGGDAHEWLFEKRVLYRCPNKACNKNFLEYTVSEANMSSPKGARPLRGVPGQRIARFTVLPAVPLPLSGNVPASITADYTEAYKIRELSPKASATLSRRALQGMVRDFWGVTKRTLAEELTAIKDKCDPDIYEALMGLKSVGNIGAHPERDISLIVDVDTGEAEELLGLLRQLDADWYGVRAGRKDRLGSIARMSRKTADAKAAAVLPDLVTGIKLGSLLERALPPEPGTNASDPAGDR